MLVKEEKDNFYVYLHRKKITTVYFTLVRERIKDINQYLEETHIGIMPF